MGVAFVPMKYLAVDVVAFDNAGFAAQHGDAFLVLVAGVLVTADGEADVTIPGAKDQHTPFAGPFDKWLVVPLAGKRATPCVIGRGSECEIRLGEPGVSRRHARIARDGSTSSSRISAPRTERVSRARPSPPTGARSCRRER